MKDIFSSIARGSFIIMSSRVILKVFSLGSFYLIINGLSLHDYGLITLALSVSGPVLALSGFGLDDLVVAQGARARGEKRWKDFASIYGGFALTKVLFTGFIVVLLFWFRTLLGGQYRELLDQFFLPLVVWIAVASIRTLLDSTLQMEEKFSWFAKANILENAVRLAIVAGLFFTHAMSVPALLWAYVAAKAVGGILISPALFRVTLISVSFVSMIRSYIRFIAGQGRWEIFRMLTGSLFSGINQWIVGLFLGLEAVALLSFASTMNSFLGFLLPFRQILFPIMARLSSEPKTSSFVARRMSKYSVWLNSAIVLLAGIGAPLVVAIFAPQYNAAVPVFWLLSFSQILNAISTSHGTLLYALSEQKFLFKLSLLGTILAMSVLPLFTWLFWVYGTVLENHLATALIIWLRERRLRQKHHLISFSFKDLLVFDHFDRMAMKRLWTALFRRVTFSA